MCGICEECDSKTSVKSIEVESGAPHVSPGEASMSDAMRLSRRVRKGFY